MRPPQLLSPAVTFAVNAARLLCGCFSRSENNTPPSPLNPPSMSAADDELPYDHYSDAVQQLLSLFPPNCAPFEVDEVKVFGDVPIEAGGYADLWEATLCGRDVIQKTYRRYETSDVESIFRVRNNGSSANVWFTLFVPEILQRGFSMQPALPPERCSVCWDYLHTKPPFLPRLRHRRTPGAQRIPQKEPPSRQVEPGSPFTVQHSIATLLIFHFNARSGVSLAG